MFLYLIEKALIQRSIFKTKPMSECEEAGGVLSLGENPAACITAQYVASNWQHN